jgi:hypothetical protein
VANPQSRFVSLAAKTVVSHTLTYSLMGVFAYYFFHYAATINQPGSGMRPTNSAILYFGPALQIFRGTSLSQSSILFAISFSAAKMVGFSWHGC